ncbi:MAG: hypothetical protein AAF402_11980 [Pseudomonadota bacterium]
MKRFKEYDIEQSTAGKIAFEKTGGRRVPVILVGDRRMNGFTESGFELLYR